MPWRKERIRKRICFVGSAILAIFLFSFVPTYPQTAEQVVLKVYLNTEDRGEYFLFLTPEGDVLFSHEDLKRLGLTSIPEEEKKYVSLTTISPRVSFHIDEEDSALHMTVDPMLLGKRTIELSHRRPSAAFRADDNAAFLNYGIDYNFDNDLNFSSLFIPLEVGMKIKGYFGSSTFSYRETETEDRFVRLFSNLTYDDPLRLRRYVIGDSPSFSGVLGSGGVFGGLTVSKNFSIDPYFTTYPGLDFSGYATTPSEVELYVNDRLVSRESVEPGKFEYEELRYATGRGDVKVVIRDAFGREELITAPFYLSTGILKPGLHEYSYTIGFRREEVGYENFEYGDLTFIGFHRYGYSRDFTAGLRSEAAGDVLNFGPSLSFVPGRWGEIETAFAVSRENDDYGFGGFLNYLYSGRSISARVSLRGLSGDYANLSISTSDDKARFGGLFGIGFHQKAFGTLSLTYSITDMHSGTDTKKATVFYNRRVFNNATLHISASRNDTDEVSNEVFASLIFSLGRKISASLNYSNLDGMTGEGATIQQNPPLGTGWGYRLSTERKEDSEGDRDLGGDAYVQYRGTSGVYSFDYRRMSGMNSYNIDVTGGLVLLNGSLYPVRPVRDSFALVDVSDLRGVKVLYNNQQAGVTDDRGNVFIPDLMSYYENKLSIDAKDIPVNYELREIEKYVVTPFRGGGVVRFEVRKLQAFTGRLRLLEEKKEIHSDYANLEITVNGEKIETIVGNRGEFYLENIPSGTYPARLFLESRECSFEITIPDIDEMMVDIGEVTCEID